MSIKDEKEYRLIEENLNFDTDKGKWLAAYPWIKSPDELPNNRNVAIATLRSLERRLGKDEELARLYQSQIEDMIT